MEKNKKIELRKYYAIRIELLSPLSISNGQDHHTDSDVLRNGSGELFVPGTSLAGAFRDYLGIEKDQQGIMGYSKGEKGRMSSLYISDMYFDEGSAEVTSRDGVKLTEEKIADARCKFDMEIIETGAQGTVFMNYILREGEESERYELAIQDILQDIQSGAIRLGANKNRGFGRLKIREVYQREFRKAEVDGWVEFLDGWKDVVNYRTEGKKDYSYAAWAKNRKKPPSRYIKIRVPLKLTGGISIRRYSAEPAQADFEHITCNGVPVIPGTSWNGAIRADAREILNELGCCRTDAVLKRWFGNIDPGEAVQSQVVIGESQIQGSVGIPMTRNQVNRFDASTVDGALYSEVAYFGGSTWLEMMVRKEKDYLALLGVLKLVIRDIQKGYLAVGGQTAVGRGIFQEDPGNKTDYSEEISEEECMSALYALIKG